MIDEAAIVKRKVDFTTAYDKSFLLRSTVLMAHNCPERSRRVCFQSGGIDNDENCLIVQLCNFTQFAYFW